MNGIIVNDEIDEGGGIIKNMTGVDISNDTVTSENLLEGETAHDREGNAVVGTMKRGISSGCIGDTIVIGGDLCLETHIDGETVLDTCVNGCVGTFFNLGVTEHDKLANRELPDQHPIDAITGLRDILDHVLTIDAISVINCGTSTEVI